MVNVVSLYCDGGVVARNPSPTGGTWAYCGVDGDGRRVLEASGYLPCTITHSPYTNNQTEFIAAIRGLKAMEPGWSGMLYSDSLVTLNRLHRIIGMARNNHQEPFLDITGLPVAWVKGAIAVTAKLGPFQMTLLAGHPSSEELRAGHKLSGSGLPVSEHNVWCDLACGDRAKDRQTEHRWSLLDGPVEQMVTITGPADVDPLNASERVSAPNVTAIGGVVLTGQHTVSLCAVCGPVVCDCPDKRKEAIT